MAVINSQLTVVSPQPTDVAASQLQQLTLVPPAERFASPHGRHNHHRHHGYAHDEKLHRVHGPRAGQRDSRSPSKSGSPPPFIKGERHHHECGRRGNMHMGHGKRHGVDVPKDAPADSGDLLTTFLSLSGAGNLKRGGRGRHGGFHGHARGMHGGRGGDHGGRSPSPGGSFAHGRGRHSGLHGRRIVPAGPATVVATLAGYTLTIEVAGLTPDDVDVSAAPCPTTTLPSVTVQAKRKAPEPVPDAQVLLQERAAASFTRSFVLPQDAATDAFSVAQQDGLLTVSIPRIPPAAVSLQSRAEADAEMAPSQPQ